SDGTRGLRAIKAAGGMTYVQTPDTAKYKGMPCSAIDDCVADRILAPGAIAQEIERLVRFPDNVPEHEGLEQRPAELTELFERVRQRTKIDFSSYKLSTVQRRLQRRMIVTETTTLSAYLAYITGHEEELDALARETLISVTEFFRDKAAFDVLARQVAELLARKKSGDDVRVWVVGCATGEEAYSLAMVFLSLIEDAGRPMRLQIFASDIDNSALTFARRGVYNQNAVAELPPGYLNRYFQVIGNGYEVSKILRDCVTFARQDIVIDPPFLRVDLVTCRNVMIYFNADLQTKVLAVLRYALRDDGLLFLGRSETANQQEGLFDALDRKARLYRPIGQGRPLSSGSGRPASRGHVVRGHKPATRQDTSHAAQFLKTAADSIGPAMLIDGGFRILHSQGDVDRFISFPSGAPEMNLAQLIVPELTNELLTTVRRSTRHHARFHSRKRRIATLDGAVWRLVVHPVLQADGGTTAFLVVFEAAGKIPSGTMNAGNNDSDDGNVVQELATTREQLQTLMEEMAASNEEMQALNEEIQASNEEMQAANEELEASNEELQATNEELVSVNEESQVKSIELAIINTEFEGVYNTIDFPVVVFDKALFLRRLNNAAVRNFGLSIAHVGQHIARLNLPDYLDPVGRLLGSVLAKALKEEFPVITDVCAFQVLMTPVLDSAGDAVAAVLVVLDNTDLVLAQQKIQASQQRLLSIMNNSVSVVMLKDMAGRYEFINRRFEELFGIQAAAAIGRTDLQLFGVGIEQILRGRDLETMRISAVLESVDVLTVGDRCIQLDSVRFPLFDQSGVVCSICTQSTDTTHRRHADEQLRLAAKVFDRSGEAIAITDAKAVILTVNDAFTKITGYTSSDVIGRDPRMLGAGQHPPEFFEEMWTTLLANGNWQGEIINRRKNGEVYPEWLSINSVNAENGSVINYVSIFRDITAVKNSQRRIEFLATHDELTGLPNRTLLNDRLKHAISVARRNRQKLAVLFIDLDNFKNINDSLGHDVGDILLRQATERLQHSVRDSDTLARLGGDEFVAVLDNVTAVDINLVAGRIVDTIGASFQINGNNLFVSASIGISIFPDDGDDSVTLLKSADTAMYSAKERGRNQYQFFANEMKMIALQRMTLETGLRLAIEAGNFSMVYQPKVQIHTGAIIGAEALLRWHDPLLGDISPVQFIPVAEGCGLIVAIGNLVFDMVLSQIGRWRAVGIVAPQIAINVSAHQLRDENFVDRIGSLITQSGLPSGCISIELTESALMERIDLVRDRLLSLEAMGVTLSVDDFGTGYSSLAYLRKLPIRELKVDRSFVDGIADQPDDRSIAKTVIDMAHALGMCVVAEGVETAAQLQVLRSDGCDIAQGFLFYRPLIADDFVQALAAQRIDVDQPAALLVP
ncbi:MAG: two-component system CheB/CheR fusion protein, partial [Burkholderiaceae bacterium]